MMLPKRENVLFKFKKEVVEFKSNNFIHNMPSGLQYLVAKELTRIDINNSDTLEYDYIRIVKQGQEIVIDLLNTKVVQERITGKIYTYIYVEIEDMLVAEVRDGNYERKVEDTTRLVGAPTFIIRATKNRLKHTKAFTTVSPRLAYSHR